MGYKYTRDTLSFMTIGQGKVGPIAKVRDVVKELKSDRWPATLEPYMPEITIMDVTYKYTAEVGRGSTSVVH